MDKTTSLFLILFFISRLYAVEHKNGVLDAYLTDISNSQHEKTELIEYMKQFPGEIFMDIGTGGDSVATMLDAIPDSDTTTLIAADIDADILNAIPVRHPQLQKYLDVSSTKNLKLMPMNATKMYSLENNTLKGVGASSVAHEIFSYVPTQSGLDLFFSEITRVLKPEGTFIYRDAAWVDNPDERCTLVIKKPIAKYFVSLFICKFLDRDFSVIRTFDGQCAKPTMHADKEIFFNVFVKNTQEYKKLSFQEFLYFPSYNIDYKKEFSLELPRGLVSEIQRHYVLFLRNVFAPGFLDHELFKKPYIDIDNIDEYAVRVFVDFVVKYNIPIKNKRIVHHDFSTLLTTKKLLKNSFKYGIYLKKTRNKELANYLQKLYQQGIPETLMHFFDEKTLFVDPKLATLLFRQADCGIFPFEGNYPIKTFEWLAREGEEHYFYKTLDELITYIAHLSKHYTKGTKKAGYLLCPRDRHALKEVPRQIYKKVLEHDMAILDQHGNTMPVITNKNIVHFCLHKEEDAIQILQQIAHQDPLKFKQLNKWLYNES